MQKNSNKKIFKKILIVGGSGLLGQEIKDALRNHSSYKVISPDTTKLDLANPLNVSAFINKERPDLVINCAAIINVDLLEAEPDLAFRINALGAGFLAKTLGQLKNKNRFIHISSNYVFGNNKKPRKETDLPDPVNYYGKSKVLGEELVRHYSDEFNLDYCIVRTSWIYSKYRKTFIDEIAEKLKRGETINVSTDQFGNPTSAKDLAEFIVKNLIQKKLARKIYHIINPFFNKIGAISRYEWALTVAKSIRAKTSLINPSKTVKILKAPRPAKAILSPSPECDLRPCAEAISSYLKSKYRL